MKYAEKLLDPRWQKKRLEILERDGWTCKYCNDDKSTLHIHHFSYAKNPWESNSGDLITACDICHLCIEYLKRENNCLSPMEFLKHKIGGNEIRMICVVLNLSNGFKEIVMIKIFDGKITDGLYVTKRTIDFITKNTSYENGESFP